MARVWRIFAQVRPLRTGIGVYFDGLRNESETRVIFNNSFVLTLKYYML